MSATHETDSTTATSPVLYVAFELSWTSWKLAFTVGAGQKPRLRSIAARDTDALLLEIQKAKHRFGLPESTPVISCYEAGRDGFWLDRFREHHGIGEQNWDASRTELGREQNWDASRFTGTELGREQNWDGNRTGTRLDSQAAGSKAAPREKREHEDISCHAHL